MKDEFDEGDSVRLIVKVVLGLHLEGGVHSFVVERFE